MVALVSAETLLLVVLLVLVVGLLRSHAEILRRLGPGGEGAHRSSGEGVPSPPRNSRPAGASAPTLTGSTPDGGAITLAFEGGAAAPTLLAFLTTGCSTCAGFWSDLAQRHLPLGMQTVIVTHGADRERVSQLRTLAPSSMPVVMSSAAWEDYEVPGSPYFVLVDGSVRGEGVATTWEALSSLLTDAIEDQREAVTGRGRARDLDTTLAAAGIGPEHPSLRPAAGDG